MPSTNVVPRIEAGIPPRRLKSRQRKRDVGLRRRVRRGRVAVKFARPLTMASCTAGARSRSRAWSPRRMNWRHDPAMSACADGSGTGECREVCPPLTMALCMDRCRSKSRASSPRRMNSRLRKRDVGLRRRVRHGRACAPERSYAVEAPHGRASGRGGAYRSPSGGFSRSREEACPLCASPAIRRFTPPLPRGRATVARSAPPARRGVPGPTRRRPPRGVRGGHPPAAPAPRGPLPSGGAEDGGRPSSP